MRLSEPQLSQCVKELSVELQRKAPYKALGMVFVKPICQERVGVMDSQGVDELKIIFRPLEFDEVF
jgi:hypothetical protein